MDLSEGVPGLIEPIISDTKFQMVLERLDVGLQILDGACFDIEDAVLLCSFISDRSVEIRVFRLSWHRFNTGLYVFSFSFLDFLEDDDEVLGGDFQALCCLFDFGFQ